MTKHKTYKRKNKTLKRQHRGGNNLLGINTFGNGNAWTQFVKSFSQTNNTNSTVPNGTQRGGNAIANASVPFALFTINNIFGKRRHTRKR